MEMNYCIIIQNIIKSKYSCLKNIMTYSKSDEFIRMIKYLIELNLLCSNIYYSYKGL